MSSAFLLAAYFFLLLSPCAMADYGDLLSLRWLPALIRRRRSHPQESLYASFRQERYAMALAAEAAFLEGTDAIFAMPKPYKVQKKAVAMETKAFLQARQRVAARLAQLVVAQKLRNDAAAEDAAVVEQQQLEVAEVAAESPVTEQWAALERVATSGQPLHRTLLEAMGIHTRSRMRQPAPMREAVAHVAEQAPAAVFGEPLPMRQRELAEVITMRQPRGGSEPTPPGPPRRKPGESSNVIEIAA